MRWFPGHTDVADEIVQAAARPGQLEVDFHDPLSANLAGAIAVVSATGDARDETISARAREAGIPVNVVDRADLSTFVFPAIVDRGEVVVAIGTGGMRRCWRGACANASRRSCPRASAISPR